MTSTPKHSVLFPSVHFCGTHQHRGPRDCEWGSSVTISATPTAQPMFYCSYLSENLPAHATVHVTANSGIHVHEVGRAATAIAVPRPPPRAHARSPVVPEIAARNDRGRRLAVGVNQRAKCANIRAGEATKDSRAIGRATVAVCRHSRRNRVPNELGCRRAPG